MLPSVIPLKSKLLLNRQVVDEASRLVVNYAGQHRRFFLSSSEDGGRSSGTRDSYPRSVRVPLHNVKKIEHNTRIVLGRTQPRLLPLSRLFGTTSRDGEVNTDESGRQVPHFRKSVVQHPLRVEKNRANEIDLEKTIENKSNINAPPPSSAHQSNKSNVNAHHTWINPTVNHVWSPDEIEQRRTFQPRHVPTSVSDRFMHLFVNGLYRSFNWATGFDKENPTVQSCAYRLILLESVAGVPGMIAAVMRHFRSLRTLKRDHGWIHTLLEEAENERMHLLVCLKIFDAGLLTRVGVIVGQGLMVGFLSAAYIVHPKSLHRFVGYLEEIAVLTYSDLTRLARTPGSHLHRGWSEMPAPTIAKDYWHLPEDAKWVDVLDNILADESHHRDVNHTFASMESDDPNPYLQRHIKDIEKLWQDIQSKKETK